jgi:ectoine hydroxylase-related dioxygenase (phytanoyl-CoA dioxygenase family)
LGRDIKQVINQIIWKAPGDARTQYGYHQDSRFRRPASAYRDLANSFVQTAIAIDPHRPENGCLRLLPGSHRLGELKIAAERSVYEEECSEASLQALGLDPSGMLDLVLEPGDVAIWHPHAIHGSGPNRSAIDRRVYLNGYVRAENCDRGAWAFRDGRPAPLGGPVLIQYEQLFTRPEAHYLEGSPHPYAGD